MWFGILWWVSWVHNSRWITIWWVSWVHNSWWITIPLFHFSVYTYQERCNKHGIIPNVKTLFTPCEANYDIKNSLIKRPTYVKNKNLTKMSCYICEFHKVHYQQIIEKFPMLRRIILEVGNYEFSFSQLSGVLENLVASKRKRIISWDVNWILREIAKLPHKCSINPNSVCTYLSNWYWWIQEEPKYYIV